ncbi:MAG: hypothetical protein HC888_12355 [Candidatus Competibacteraceae bacterium]|nr:hypothetical protein [Candidatus Competibacteraceae bacterium]
MEDENPEDRRHGSSDKREKTTASLGALAAAVSLAWVLSSAWVGFRDGVLFELNACASRIELLEARVEQYYRDRDPWIERIKLLERQREQLIERLQAALDRIRDLELGKRP